MNKDQIKKEAMEMCKDWDLDDMKEAFAEVCEQGILLGAEFDVFKDEIKAIVSNIACALYMYSLTHLAVKKLLLESGLISSEDLAREIENCPEKERLAMLLGNGFFCGSSSNAFGVSKKENWMDCDNQRRNPN